MVHVSLERNVGRMFRMTTPTTLLDTHAQHMSWTRPSAKDEAYRGHGPSHVRPCIMLTRRHFLTRAAGLSAAALAVTLPPRGDTPVSVEQILDPSRYGGIKEASLTDLDRYNWSQGERYLTSTHVMSKAECERRGLPWTWS